MTEQERYEQIDLPFYRDQISPLLPPSLLDFHAHFWTKDQWRQVPWEANVTGSKYMVTITDYSAEQLLSDARMIFPDQAYNAVCFGNPTPAIDLVRTNAYAAGAQGNKGVFPLLVTGRDTFGEEELQKLVADGGFFGYKVFLNWQGNDYGAVTVQDMIGPRELALADKLGLIVLLHVPRSGRLADPVVQQGVREIAGNYPGLHLVLAHCGRCYLPEEMMQAITSIADLKNVYLDTAMVMDPIALQMVFEHLDATRVFFATDFPVAVMRGRRVQVMDHWVDLVLEGYPASGYRVGSDNMRASFMAYEIVRAIHLAGKLAGLSEEVIRGVYYANGMAVLGRANRGKALQALKARWS